MKILLSAAAAFLCAAGCAGPLSAQNVYTPVTAANLTIAGTAIASGTLTIAAVDAGGSPIAIRTADNSVFLPGPSLTATITAGAIPSGLQVPDQCTARAIKATASVNMLVTYSTTIAGKLYSSSFTSAATAPFFCGTAPAAINSFAQPLTATVMGAGLVTSNTVPLHCTAPAIWYSPLNPSALYSCASGVFVAITGSTSLPVAAAPTTSIPTGTYTTSQTPTLATTTPQGRIYVTTDGITTPTSASTLYSTALSIATTTTIKAVTCATGYTCSPVVTFVYTISGSSTSVFPQTAPFSAVALGTDSAMNGFLPYCPSPTNCSDIYHYIRNLPADAARSAAFHAGPHNYETAGLNADFMLVAASQEYHVVKPSINSAITMVPTVSNYTLSTGMYDSESIDVPFPYQTGYSVEGGGTLDSCSTKTGDVHPLIVNADTGILIESYVGAGSVGGFCNGKIQMNQTTVWNLLQPIEGQLPAGQTTTDAAGLPLFGLSARPEDVQAGVIKHALRVTFPNLQGAFKNSASGGDTSNGAGNDTFALVQSPAKHSAGLENAAYQTWPGQRLRLKLSKDVTTCGSQAQVIMQAMQDYGLIVADIGNPLEIQGVNSSYWNADQMSCLYTTVKGSDMEVVSPQTLTAVDLSPENPTYGSGLFYDQTAKTSYAQGAGTRLTPATPAPQITSFTASCNGGAAGCTSVPLGGTITFTAAATNAANMVIGHAGAIAGSSGSITITPTDNDTYVLSAYNGSGYEVSGRTDGRTNPASITISVTGTATATPTSSPAPGNSGTAVTVALADATSGAAVYYTTDGSAPTQYSTSYTAPFTVSSPKTVKAIAYKTGLLKSGVLTAFYNVVIAGATPSVVAITPGAPAFDYPPRTQAVTFTAGNTAVMEVMYNKATGNPPTSVVCNGHAATQAVSTVSTSGPNGFAIYVLANVDGGAQNCTATWPSAVDGAILSVTEVSGTSGVDAVASSNTANSGSTLSCGAPVASGTNRLAFVVGGGLYASATLPSGYTQVFSTSGIMGAFTSVPAAGAATLALTNDYANGEACASILLKP